MSKEITVAEFAKTPPTIAQRLSFRMTEDEFRAGDNDSEGRCLACGDAAYGVEPDARRYECEACGERRVYGLQELLMMGRIEITEA